MISQETKDQIENDARQNAKAYRNSFEPKLVSKDTLLEAELAYRYSEIAVATKYAEKLEEKDKIIESKDKELMAMANTTRQTELTLKLQLESKDREIAMMTATHTMEGIDHTKKLDSCNRELAQLKEIGSKLFNSLRDLDFMLSVFDPRVSQNDIKNKVFTLMDMAERLNGCKQNKAK